MKFYLLNVFTKNNFAGNQLAAVFPDSFPDPERMQAIAREFNFSETIFVCDPRGTPSVRIFTPKTELPFAGHPTVGAAFILSHLKYKKVAFELQVPLGRTSVVADASGALVTFPGEVSLGEINESLPIYLQGCGVSLDDVYLDDVRMATAGPEFMIIPVRSREVLAGAKSPLSSGTKVRGYFIFRESSQKYHVRMFSPSLGIGEDAATGSAACALAGYLSQHKKELSGEVTISQGKEMSRECEIKLKWGETIQVGGMVHLWGEGDLL
ncbi:MAG TPA: PhzF family phenazine biosynthesis protein [Bacteriovoracaceae bacterium]|nr:PhzF family phenazine biosynthesis protein [Bacteriovoracaceae bacterium]